MSESNMQNTHSPYTPRTEEVREYLTRVQGTGSSLAQAQAEAIGLWFDRWLIAERKRVAEMAVERLFSKLTRVTLVDDDRNGIQYERYDIQVEPSIQDNGKTLKLFIKGNSPKVS